MRTLPRAPRCNSWIIVSKDTGLPVFETFEARTASRVNTERYEVLTALAWLQRFNAQVKREALAG